MKHAILFVLCLSLTLLIGCSGTPQGFPKVVPCTVTVLDGTSPIVDVEVTLQAATPSGGAVFYGQTNETGVCKVGTLFASHYKAGVPEGSYKVVLVKEPFVEETKTREEQGAMSRSELDAYRKQMRAKRDALPRIIPVALTAIAKTPLTIDVSGKMTELTIDVAQYK